jgi:hypothetical protein
VTLQQWHSWRAANSAALSSHGTVTILGVQSGGRADRGTPTCTQWNPAANTPHRPSQQQLDAHRKELEWGSITTSMIATLRT